MILFRIVGFEDGDIRLWSWDKGKGEARKRGNREDRAAAKSAEEKYCRKKITLPAIIAHRHPPSNRYSPPSASPSVPNTSPSEN